ncbi:hypothetical protein GGD61_007187 [Bradyrhizobium sp. SBR1B]|nr:hypothetical protein [Bradyrhizobium sp. SBR1B]
MYFDALLPPRGIELQDISSLATPSQFRCGEHMRVTLVLPYAGLSGGIRVLSIYAEGLYRRGHEVTVVSQPRTRKPLLGSLKSLVFGKGWPNESGTEPSFFDGCAARHHVLALARPVMDDKATYWNTAPGVAALSPRKGAKTILLQGYETSPGQWERAMDAAWRLSDTNWRGMSEAALATASSYTRDDATDLLESALRDIIRDAARPSGGGRLSVGEHASAPTAPSKRRTQDAALRGASADHVLREAGCDVSCS